jgi:hypothetical protein
MSRQLIGRNPDLRRLRDDGYTVIIVSSWLVIGDVPYLDASGEPHTDGKLVMALTLAGDQTQAPQDHTAYFVGGVPHGQDGEPLNKIINNCNATELAAALVAACYFSAKPIGRSYRDFEDKVVAYVGHIAGPAQAVDPDLTAQRYRPDVTEDSDDGPFRYLDTASARSSITEVAQRLATERVGIIGLGGSGRYVLDFVAKTWVPEIHLFDADRFLSHNAFREPGASTLEELNTMPFKVEHAAAIYDRMRTGIVTHPIFIDHSNSDVLKDLTFVFIVIDDAVAKAPIVEALLRFEIPFVDLGMGVEVVDGRLTGIIRSTTVTPAHPELASRIPTLTVQGDDDYRSNVQIAELNALNATLAVMAWKRYRGIYADADGPANTMLSIDTNSIINEPASAFGTVVEAA